MVPSCQPFRIRSRLPPRGSGANWTVNGKTAAMTAADRARTSRETRPMSPPSSGFHQVPSNLRCLTSRFAALLRDDVANGFEALFIIARHLVDVLGEHPHHRDLEPYERFDRVEPNGGAGSHPALLFLGYAAGVKALVCVSHFVSHSLGFAPSRTKPTPAGRCQFGKKTLKIVRVYWGEHFQSSVF